MTLTDALTLDFGAEQPHYVQGLKCTSTSADTILESHEPTYYNADNRELTQSCPLLSSKQVGPYVPLYHMYHCPIAQSTPNKYRILMMYILM